ncbi:hypothetical protein HYH03_015364 [Edaphochlamys debaryana]|uniref:Serine aminopeptidase S33 domain-containing protein n=1 Tax=Edaphochlamys debaryana TaxID=47281 RepID=A0A836BR83_9CHLO|nr:hypothetical protein HYH03_015364 [Edaphochlamys debaryana]|eukprot:KAG2485920.1 hypothetical protein HYH03_015364 [Edaphochlamys debaryana]
MGFGCLSSGGQVVPESNFDHSSDYLGPRGYEKKLISKRGVPIHGYFWPANPEVPLLGVVQLAHGNGTYCCFDFLRFQGPGLPNLYVGSWVASLNAAGWAVAGADHVGFGRSGGVRAHCGAFQEHVDNLLLLADHVRSSGGEAFPASRRPHFLLAHSMGGLAAVMAALQQPGRFAGLVLLAPLLSLARRAAEVAGMRPLLSLLSALVPRMQLGPGPHQVVRHQPWIFDAWDADPYVYSGRLRARVAATYLAAAEALAGPGPGGMGGPGLALPLLLFQSERDTHVEPEGSRELARRAPSKDKTLRMLTAPWHVLTKEEGWEALRDETLDWLAVRAGPAPGGEAQAQAAEQAVRQEPEARREPGAAEAAAGAASASSAVEPASGTAEDAAGVACASVAVDAGADAGGRFLRRTGSSGVRASHSSSLGRGACGGEGVGEAVSASGGDSERGLDVRSGASALASAGFDLEALLPPSRLASASSLGGAASPSRTSMEGPFARARHPAGGSPTRNATGRSRLGGTLGLGQVAEAGEERPGSSPLPQPQPALLELPPSRFGSDGAAQVSEAEEEARRAATEAVRRARLWGARGSCSPPPSGCGSGPLPVLVGSGPPSGRWRPGSLEAAGPRQARRRSVGASPRELERAAGGGGGGPGAGAEGGVAWGYASQPLSVRSRLPPLGASPLPSLPE